MVKEKEQLSNRRGLTGDREESALHAGVGIGLHDPDDDAAVILEIG